MSKTVFAGKFLVFIAIVLFTAGSLFAQSTRTIAPGQVYVKFVEGTQALSAAGKTGQPQLDKILGTIGVTKVDQVFPELLSFGGKKAPNLTRIYSLTFDPGQDPMAVAQLLERSPEVEYADPKYIYWLEEVNYETIQPSIQSVTEIPNDPQYTAMTQLGVVNLPAAWDVVKGEDGDVVIAIVDGGTDWNHEDLFDNIWINPGEDLNGDGIFDSSDENGVDDDGNGFVDDVIGWNFANESNDPTGLASLPQSASHGTFSAGMAAAVANNGVGVVGSSWNAKILPVCVASPGNDRSIGRGYEGIAYAGALGADIINTSWGGIGGGSSFERDIVNQVTDGGSLIVAAAGNGGDDGISDNNDVTPHYPSNYERVLSVGATNKANNGLSSFSNFGITVDVYAPGVSVESTQPSNQYGASSGTSFSSPLVAGIAALVKTQNPGYSADEVREHLRATAVNIESENGSRVGVMGQGRADAKQAVTVSGKGSIRLVDISMVNAEGEDVLAGEDAILTAKFAGYLNDVSSVVITLTSDANATITTGTANFATVAAGDTVTATFNLSMSVDTPGQHLLPLYFDIAGTGLAMRAFGVETVNPPPIITHDTGLIQASVSGVGNIGHVGLSGVTYGNGLTFDGADRLFEGGLMMGTSSSRLSDCVRATAGVQDQEFARVISGGKLSIAAGEFSTEYTNILMDDAPANNPLNITIHQESFANTDADNDNYIIVNYQITNDGTSTLRDFYVGLFADWDVNLSDASADYAKLDEANQLSYVQDSNVSPTAVVGIKLLNDDATLFNHRSVDNPTEVYGGTGNDGFTGSEKYNFLSGGIQTREVNASDVSTITSAGPYSIAAGGTIEVGFAIMAGSSLAELVTAGTAAENVWVTSIADPNANAAPVFTAASIVADTTMLSGETFTHQFTATDANDDAITYSLATPVDNASIDASGLLTFTPAGAQVGATTEIVVEASDGQLAASTSFMVTVNVLDYSIESIYPNPSSNAAGGFTLNMNSPDDGTLKILVYDVLGREVASIADGEISAGPINITWNATDYAGAALASGIYVYTVELVAGDESFTETLKFVIQN